MNVLISSVGRRNYIVEYFQEYLKDKDNVIVVNSIENTSGVFASSKSIIAPPIDSEEYIPFLLTVCKEHNVTLLVSLFDQDLMKISSNKSLFQNNGIAVAVSDKEVIELTFDKFKFIGFIESIGLNSPKTFKGSNSISKIISQDKLSFPLMLKPRWGTGSLATQIVTDQDEYNFFIKYLKKKLKSTYINKVSSLSVQNEILVQEFIEGEEYHLDVINDFSGNYVTTFPKKKLGMRGGETEAAVTIKDTQLMEIGAVLGKELKHVGLLDIDLMKNSKGKYFIIDANPRFGGGYPFSHEAGANIPACLISWAKNEAPNPLWLEIKYGVLSVKGIKLYRREK